jgi:hypothetical protein
LGRRETAETARRTLSTDKRIMFFSLQPSQHP